MAYNWAKLPINWIRYDDKLRHFSIKDIGASIAALKIYIAIVLAANFCRSSGVIASLPKCEAYNKALESGVRN